MLFTMFVLFLFGWLFFHSIGLALHLTWCAAKVIAALLFAVALPVLPVLLLEPVLLPEPRRNAALARMHRFFQVLLRTVFH